MPATDSTRHLLRLAMAFQHLRLLLAAVELGVFTELGRGPRTIERLRAALPTLGDGLPEFLEALVVAGLLGREGEDHGAVYANTRDSARLLDAAFPGGDVMVLGCGPAHDQTAVLQQLIGFVSRMESAGGVLVVMDCMTGESSADGQPVRALEQWCREAGFTHTQIVPLVTPVCAVLAHR